MSFLSSALMFTTMNILIFIKPATAYPVDLPKNEVASVLNAGTNIKLPLEGIIKKDYLKLHKIESRRAKGHRPSSVPEMCSFQGRIALRGDCEQYIICQRSGTKPKLGVCPPNKRFHHQLRMCINMTMEGCQAVMCQTTTDKFPDPYDRENYLGCRAMIPKVHTCPEGTIYKDDRKACVKGSPLEGFKEAHEEDRENVKTTETERPFVENT